MLKTHHLCKVCRAIQTDKLLLKRIYNTAFYMRGGETLKNLALDYDVFTYENLRNHVKKHQYMDEKDFNSRNLRQIAKKAERDILKKTIESQEVWNEVINKGMQKLQDGELQMSTGDVLRAAKDKSDYEMKVKDQQLAMMEMVYHFASGENNKQDVQNYDRRIITGQAVTDYDPADGATGNPEDGTNEPRGIHYPPAWDAAAPGSDQVPEADHRA